MPTLLYAASRTHYPIISITLVELRTLGSEVPVATVEDEDRIAYSLGSIGRELTNSKHRVETASAVCPTINEIATAIVIP